MKVLIVSFFVACTSGFNVNPPEERSWENFKIKFERKYESLAEEYLRKKIFIENLREIQAFNSENHSFKQGINHFSDLTTEEFGNMLNYSKDFNLPTNSTREFRDEEISKKSNPDSIDWRNHNGKNFVGAVRSQGHCGSCWSFSSLGSLEAMLVIYGVLPKVTLLSEQQLIDCFKHDCHGSQVPRAYDYIKANGVVSDESYPYVSGESSQANDCKVDLTKVVGKITGYVKLKGEDELKTAVAQAGPTSISLCVHVKSFKNYESGIYDDPECESEEGCSGRHAVVAVGYGTEGGKDFWIIKNSWGKEFGEKGYIRLVRGVQRCKVAYTAAYPIVV